MIRKGSRAASTGSVVGKDACHRPAVPDWELVTRATRRVRQDVSEALVREACAAIAAQGGRPLTTRGIRAWVFKS